MRDKSCNYKIKSGDLSHNFEFFNLAIMIFLPNHIFIYLFIYFLSCDCLSYNHDLLLNILGHIFIFFSLDCHDLHDLSCTANDNTAWSRLVRTTESDQIRVISASASAVHRLFVADGSVRWCHSITWTHPDLTSLPRPHSDASITATWQEDRSRGAA